MSERGFSLIEMAITLAVLSVILVLFMNYQITLSINSQTDKTAIKLKMIEQTIKVYAINNGKPPCPSPLDIEKISEKYGISDCSVKYGGIPFKDLEIDSSYALDGTNKEFGYAFEDKTFTINDENNNELTDDAIYAIYSLKKNKNDSSLEKTLLLYKTKKELLIEIGDEYVKCDEHNYGEEKKLQECEDGKYSVFMPTQKCLKYGVWSDNIYPCQDIACPDISQMAGIIGLSDYSTYTNILQHYKKVKNDENYLFQCINGKSGWIELKCKDGSWQHISGQCI